MFLLKIFLIERIAWDVNNKLVLELTERKSLGYPKRMIRSVASWWWYNVHDDKCTEGYQLPEWITSYPPQTMEDTYDEMKAYLHEDSEPR